MLVAVKHITFYTIMLIAPSMLACDFRSIGDEAACALSARGDWLRRLRPLRGAKKSHINLPENQFI